MKINGTLINMDKVRYITKKVHRDSEDETPFGIHIHFEHGEKYDSYISLFFKSEKLRAEKLNTIWSKL